MMTIIAGIAGWHLSFIMHCGYSGFGRIVKGLYYEIVVIYNASQEDELHGYSLVIQDGTVGLLFSTTAKRQKNDVGRGGE
jgi:hypothetical protein